MSIEPRWPIPKSWSWTSIGSIADVTGGGTPPANDPTNFVQDGGIAWITPADLAGYEKTFIERGRRSLSEQGYRKSAAKLLPAGAVLFTSRAPIGYCAIAANPIATNQGFKSLTLFGGISAEFARYYLRWSKQFLENFASGTTFLELSSSKVQQVPFPLPPLAEQKRIVAKLDALNARLRHAHTELTRVEALVSHYKKAVLTKFFDDGLRLIEDTGANSDKKANHLSHWKITQLGEIADVKAGITLGKKRKSDDQLLELPYLRVANVQRGWLDLREMKTVGVTAKEARALILREGDVLMNEGGDRDKLGRGWVWDGQIANCIHQNHVFRVRLKPGTIPPRYLSYYTNEFGQKHFFDEGKQTTNLASISKSKLSEMLIPVPSYGEAEEIVFHIEAAFAKIDRVADHAKYTLGLVRRLNEALLAEAFRGELVDQDQNDEPASSLLERIERHRINQPSKTKIRIPVSQGKTLDMARTIFEVLDNAKGWLSSQELFERCGVQDGSHTEDVEKLYRQLLDLYREEKIDVQEITDLSSGLKLGDRVKLRK
ncbi:type I restriction endonuclease subunit S [Methylobacterium terricola]|uniref:Type I restriction endonuclease subunit S n=1 Tax=Methylobacterium terricola TaxID=2583531 RepID=A0A5C4LB90_9HYPH|nr:restriction endonuclease subunit S [Methylobacterium terricola]TNC09086.1 type I restriction endonuclease subunit S [Methylobacterium terricola]